MKMNYARLLTVTCLCAAFTACSGKNTENKPATNNDVAPQATAPASLPVSGHTVSQMTSAPADVRGGDVVKFPALAARGEFLKSITRVDETDAHAFDLYAGDRLVLSLHQEAGMKLSVIAAVPEYAAAASDLIVYTEPRTTSQDQTETTVQSISFTMNDCRNVEQGKPDQGQDKGQGKGQDKGQDKPVVQECMTVNATLNLTKIVQKPDQKQDQKGQDQGQDKGKGKPAPVAPVDKGGKKG